MTDRRTALRVPPNIACSMLNKEPWWCRHWSLGIQPACLRVQSRAYRSPAALAHIRSLCPEHPRAQRIGVSFGAVRKEALVTSQALVVHGDPKIRGGTPVFDGTGCPSKSFLTTSKLARDALMAGARPA